MKIPSAQIKKATEKIKRIEQSRTRSSTRRIRIRFGPRPVMSRNEWPEH